MASEGTLLPVSPFSLSREGCRRILEASGFPAFFKQQNSHFRLKSYSKFSIYKRVKAVLFKAHTLSSLAVASLAGSVE